MQSISNGPWIAQFIPTSNSKCFVYLGVFWIIGSVGCGHFGICRFLWHALILNFTEEMLKLFTNVYIQNLQFYIYLYPMDERMYGLQGSKISTFYFDNFKVTHVLFENVDCIIR